MATGFQAANTFTPDLTQLGAMMSSLEVRSHMQALTSLAQVKWTQAT